MKVAYLEDLYIEKYVFEIIIKEREKLRESKVDENNYFINVRGDGMNIF